MSANTRIDVARGTGRTALGDEVDLPLPAIDVEPTSDEAVILTPRGGIAASLIERSSREFDHASGTWRSVRYIAARFAPLVTVLPGDVVRDRRTGRVYPIDRIVESTGLGGSRAVRCDLRGTLSE